MPAQPRILFLSILFLLLSCNPESGIDKKNDWLKSAIETEIFIENSGIDLTEGRAWKVMPDSINSGPDLSLYTGTPGIVLFYLELYAATEDPAYLNEAEMGAEYLIDTIRNSKYNAGEMGLYTGLAGAGYCLVETFRATGKNRYRNEIINTVKLIESTALKTAEGIHWAGMTDIIYGGAGIGLYLQRVADVLQYPKADSLATLAAKGLLDLAIASPSGLRWKFTPEYGTYMDNFSHGTAGVAYFLSETYLRTGENKYLDAALKAADILDSLANDKGYIPHHCPGGENLFYLNWCHGPAGTSRLYYSLYMSTKDRKWLDTMKRVADEMMAEGIDEHQTPGYWNNVGKCCGSAGVAEYYLWMHQITGEEKYLDYCMKMTKQLIHSATRGNGPVKWIHAEHRARPDYVAAQTGLMQGSAGIGLWFLQLQAFMNGKEPFVNMPDKPLGIRNTDD